MRQRRASFGRRARAAIGWAALLFVVVQLVSGAVLDYGFPLLRFPSAGEVLGAVRQDPTPPEFAFFGSSRTGAAIHFDVLDDELSGPNGQPPPRSVTLAVPAADAIPMEFLLDQLLKTGPLPVWALIEISPESTNGENAWWMPVHVLRQLTWEDVPTYSVAAIKSNAAWPYLESRMVPTYTYRKEIVVHTRHAIHEWASPPAPAPTAGTAARPKRNPLDWANIIRAPTARNRDELFESSRVGSRTIIRKSLTPYRVGGPVVAALERMLAKCQAHGIRVILLDVPACSPHRAEHTPAIEAAYSDYLRKLEADYGCRYLDCRDWVADDEFMDALHLDVTGGRHFSKRLAEEVLKPLASK